MSQAKVDKYKQEKANRKEIMRKEKLQNTIRRCVVGVVAVALMGWIGYSAYNTYATNAAKEEVEIDYTSYEEFVQSLTTE